MHGVLSHPRRELPALSTRRPGLSRPLLRMLWAAPPSGSVIIHHPPEGEGRKESSIMILAVFLSFWRISLEDFAGGFRTEVITPIHRRNFPRSSVDSTKNKGNAINPARTGKTTHQSQASDLSNPDNVGRGCLPDKHSATVPPCHPRCGAVLRRRVF